MPNTHANNWKRFEPLALILLAAAASAASDGSSSTPPACNGLPRLQARVADGFCVGVAARNLRRPRGVLPLPDGSVLVVDSGGWTRGKGRVIRLQAAEEEYRQTTVFAGLNRPHAVQAGPDGWIYIGEDDRISRFDPQAVTPVLQAIIAGLPSEGEHPLKALAFMPDGSLLVSFGAPSNNCEHDAGRSQCQEAEGDQPRGALWRFAPEAGNWQGAPYALGLRNPIALAVDRLSGDLWVADNARDAITAAMGRPDQPDDELPHDLLNLVHQGARFGWPYCYDAGVPSPEFPAAHCDRYEKPTLLLPAHAAPIGMAVYRSAAAPKEWRDVLVITFHGYRSHGHRIVGLDLGEDGMARGPLRNLVVGTGGKSGRPTLDAPADIKSDAGGNLWVTDERTGTVLRISPER